MQPFAPGSLFADLRRFPRSAWVLFAGTFINRFGTFVWPFLTFYVTRQGYSPTAAGFTVSAFGLGGLTGSLIGGWLADHWGRRPTIVLGTFASGVLVMLLYTAQTLPQIIAATALLGIANGMYPPASSALIADIVPPELRVRAYATFRLAVNAGFACGAASGGVLAHYSFFWLFVGDGVTTWIFGCVALMCLPGGKPAKPQGMSLVEAFRVMHSHRDFRMLWLGSLCIAVVYSQCATTYSVYVTQLNLSLDILGYHAAPEAIYGLLLGWNGLLIVLAELPLTAVTLRYHAPKVIALGYILCAFGFAANAMSHSIGMLWICMTIFTIGEMISAPTVQAAGALLAPEDLRGRYMGVLSLSWSLSAIIGPLLGLRLFAKSPGIYWLICGVLGMVAAILALQLRHQSLNSVKTNSARQ